MPDVQHISLVIPADRKYLSLVTAFVQEVCEVAAAMDSAESYNIQLAVDEAVVNIITHAYQDDPSGKVEIIADIDAKQLAFRICDWGLGFDPENVPQPDLSTPHEQGYGVYLMRELMDQVVYDQQPREGSHCVTLIKKL